jgi:hypothetical protein
MKTYIQFFTMSTGYIAETIPPKFGKPEVILAIGDRSVIQVDGRLKEQNIVDIALEECRDRGFYGYQILKGENLLDAKPVSKYWVVR